MWLPTDLTQQDVASLYSFQADSWTVLDDVGENIAWVPRISWCIVQWTPPIVRATSSSEVLEEGMQL